MTTTLIYILSVKAGNIDFYWSMVSILFYFIFIFKPHSILTPLRNCGQLKYVSSLRWMKQNQETWFGSPLLVFFNFHSRVLCFHALWRTYKILLYKQTRRKTSKTLWQQPWFILSVKAGNIDFIEDWYLILFHFYFVASFVSNTQSILTISRNSGQLKICF